MPIPKPKKNEDKDKFIDRCMSNKTMKKEVNLEIVLQKIKIMKEDYVISDELFSDIIDLSNMTYHLGVKDNK